MLGMLAGKQIPSTKSKKNMFISMQYVAYLDHRSQDTQELTDFLNQCLSFILRCKIAFCVE
jgi:hypothetical protein